jgi:hypothetical protein
VPAFLIAVRITLKTYDGHRQPNIGAGIFCFLRKQRYPKLSGRSSVSEHRDNYMTRPAGANGSVSAA